MTAAEQNGKLIITLDRRIDTGNAAQIENEVLAVIRAHEGTNVVFDAEQLEYISSSGLRVLLKVIKMFDDRPEIVHVSAEIYDILDMTGFTEMMNVQTDAEIPQIKPMREISIEGKEMLSLNGFASYYRLDSETVVKVFIQNVNFELLVQREAENARNALVAGIPTVIPYDTVKVGDRYGIVYEMQDFKNLFDAMLEDKAHMDDYIRRFAKLLKKVHSIEVDPAKFESNREAAFKVCENLSGFLSKEEREKLHAVFANMPERHTFLHGAACRLDSTIIQNGELLLVDLGAAASGHPISDLFAMYHTYKKHGRYVLEEAKKILLYPFTYEEAERIWNVFITTYLGTEDPALIAEAEEQIDLMDLARMLCTAVVLPGKCSAEEYDEMKKQVLAYYDKGLKPICF